MISDNLELSYCEGISNLVVIHQSFQQFNKDELKCVPSSLMS